MTFKEFSREIDTLILSSIRKNKTQNVIKNFLKGEISEIDSKESINLFFNRLKKKAAKEFESIEYSINLEGSVEDKMNEIQEIFFPENLLDYEESVKQIREKRRVNVSKLDEPIIKNPYKEILITSNILLTMPENKDNLPYEYKSKLDFQENQKYWYDHPVPIDAQDSENEIIYGLQKLNESVSIETNEKVNVVLSISCTHDSLNAVAKRYLRNILRNYDLDHLNIYAFTENDVNKMIDIIIKDEIKRKEAKKVIGVSGKYGRHYSFLKAVAAFWSYYIDPNIKATFKIDLDQVFDQKALQKYTGKFAFEIFKDRLWGAVGTHNAEEVKLGMIAGSLVNDYDIKKSLFEPDIKKEEDISYDKYIFNSQKPQYISTIAEMGTSYKKKDSPIIRYHVTGGTNGILVEDLINFKPFTPSFIGRAEDQAFIISVLNKKVHGKYLRYYHNDKLVMRHDKHNLIKKTIEKSKIGKLIGDYERILLFSYYATDILDNYDFIKEELFPFTGCFITKIPFLTVYFRTLLKAYSLAENDELEAKEFLIKISDRLNEIISKIEDGYYKREFLIEKNVWENFYNSFIEKNQDNKTFLEAIHIK
jgi:hypothetical protein